MRALFGTPFSEHAIDVKARLLCTPQPRTRASVSLLRRLRPGTPHCRLSVCVCASATRAPVPAWCAWWGKTWGDIAPELDRGPVTLPKFPVDVLPPAKEPSGAYITHSTS